MRTAVVYRAYSESGELLYVGQTGNLAQRIKGHRSERPWWMAEVARVEHDAPRRYDNALAAERHQIQALRPRYNQRREFRDGHATFSLRYECEKIERLREIAAGEGLNLAQKLRRMIAAEIARHSEAA